MTTKTGGLLSSHFLPPCRCLRRRRRPLLSSRPKIASFEKRGDKRGGKVHDARSIPLNHNVEEGIVEGTEKTKSGSGGSTTSKTPSSFSISGPRFSPSLDRRPSSFFGSSFLVTKRAGCDVVNNKKIRTRPWRFSRRVKRGREEERWENRSLYAVLVSLAGLLVRSILCRSLSSCTRGCGFYRGRNGD